MDATPPTHLRVVHRPWPRPLGQPNLPGPAHDRIGLTSRYLTRDGRPWIPVSGEIHYSRVPRERWRERVALMRSGGIDVVASYIIWNHHQPSPGPARFDGNLDVAAFVRLCGELGLHVVLRIGPWVHGEVRNGGFPDWVHNAPVAHRTNDPAYLDLVRTWFTRLGAELADLCGPASAIVGIQIENELCDQSEHLRTLTTMARTAGLTAPLYTATAWGGAQLPPGELLPVYSGYGDGFWVDADAPWEDSFRQHYFFSRQWDDPGVGADVRGEGSQVATPRPRDESFPPATCELGGGMAIAYHRRIAPDARDIAAIANAKLGSGSAWQGYYMFAGGTNPPGPESMAESHATGYPNDMPWFDYDFHAPIGASGALSPTHAALRTQHAFIENFGAVLATMPASWPDRVPDDVSDAGTLRWALRSNGTSGFVFINWHQPHVPLPTLRGVRLQVDLPGEQVQIAPEGIDIPPGTIARWPLGLDVGGVRIRWATASVLARPDPATLVLMAEPGIEVEIAAEDRVHRLDGRTGGALDLCDGDRRATVLVIGYLDADRIWVAPERADPILRCSAPLWIEDGRVAVRSGEPPRAESWSPDAGWQAVDLTAEGPARRPQAVGFDLERAAGEVPVDYGWFNARPSAPGMDMIAARAAHYRLHDLGEVAEGVRRDLQIDWAGDVAQLLVDGRVVADRFWDGTPWQIDLDVLDGAQGDRVSLRLLPLHPNSPVRLPADAEDRRRATAGALMALDAVTITHSTIWRSVQ